MPVQSAEPELERDSESDLAVEGPLACFGLVAVGPSPSIEPSSLRLTAPVAWPGRGPAGAGTQWPPAGGRWPPAIVTGQ